MSWEITWELGEPDENHMRTWWEHIKNKRKKILPPSLPQRKKLDPSWVHGGCMKLFISITICNHFWPGLLAGAQTVGHSSKMKSFCRHSSPWKVVIRVGLPLTNYSIVWWQKGFMCTFLFAQPHCLWKKLALNSCKCRELMWMEIKPECFCTLYNQFLRYANRNLRAWWGK
jgi:hypothetical protein